MRVDKIVTVFFLMAFGFACGGSKFNLAPTKTFDPDNANIPEPKVKEEYQIWDIVDYTFIYQLEKPLDLNWLVRKTGKGLGVAKRRQADNVNVLDEVPNSSWYNNRHYHNRMTIDELKRGPNVTDGPDQNGSWTIIAGKFEGGSTGFTIKDAKGERYLLKFDPPDFTEMGSSAEVISTKILYACGYNVPQNTVEYFNPGIFQIGETAKVVERGHKRAMSRADLDALLRPIPRRADGKIRALASKFVDGKPVGVWNYRGTRGDDPNDRVHHEHRRELRGLRSIGSWLSDEDRRAANTLAVYTKDNRTDNRYIKHYLIDMGSTLGSNNIIPHAPKYGNEYLVDPRTVGLQFITLGAWVKPWEFESGHINPEFPSVGYYESKIFNPAEWYPTYPNPAFEYCTPRDAFWGAKIVMSFSDEDIRAIVAEAKMSDKRAEAYLIRTMIERRDKVGRHWFERMNPLDKFRFEYKEDGLITMIFNDLAVDGNLELVADTRYVYTISHQKKGLRKHGYVDLPSIPISRNGEGFFDELIATNGIDDEEDKIFSIELQSQRRGEKLSKSVEVYFYYPGGE
ncbi:MAG: hypothetical protein VST67_06690, partial [Nitrospirota bacterium]|nr:hypothetical protein [Nitrospirota bacterium]